MTETVPGKVPFRFNANSVKNISYWSSQYN